MTNVQSYFQGRVFNKMTFKSRHISVSINRPADEVYAFASNPENLPKWATGLTGNIKIQFADKNRFGILDHVVTLPDGKTFHNPMRVFPNNGGSELVFTLYRQPEMTDQMFEEDAKTIMKDLQKLKALLEK